MSSDVHHLCQDCPDVAACFEAGGCDRERRASSVAFPTSGDPVADRRAALDWARYDERIERGQCPNGCGPLVTDPGDERHRDCPLCGFHHAALSLNARSLS